jgi:hypothetical protein
MAGRTRCAEHRSCREPVAGSIRRNDVVRHACARGLAEAPATATVTRWAAAVATHAVEIDGRTGRLA